MGNNFRLEKRWIGFYMSKSSYVYTVKNIITNLLFYFKNFLRFLNHAEPAVYCVKCSFVVAGNITQYYYYFLACLIYESFGCSSHPPLHNGVCDEDQGGKLVQHALIRCGRQNKFCNKTLKKKSRFVWQCLD